jgi:hypothetical protein
MLSGALSKNRLFDLSLAAKRRQEKKDSGKIVQKYREIYRSQAFKEIEADRLDEEKVVNMRSERLRKAQKVHFKKVIKELIKELKRNTKPVFLLVRKNLDSVVN